MIKFTNRALQPLCSPSSAIGNGLTFKKAYSYIRKRDLDEIEKAHGSTRMQRLMMYSKQAKHIYSEGFKSMKKDLNDSLSLFRKKDEEMTAKDKQLMKRLRKQMECMKAMIIIQILPFSGPILLFYLYTYPTSIPSWFCIDSLHESYQSQCILKQAEAIKYFKQNPIKDPVAFNPALLSIEELKKLSELLFGHYEDGVFGYNQLVKTNPREYLFHPKFTKHLLIRNIRKEFKDDIRKHPELQPMSLEEMILWKYEKVLNGEHVLTFTPIHHQPETAAQPTPPVQKISTSPPPQQTPSKPHATSRQSAKPFEPIKISQPTEKHTVKSSTRRGK